jgi:thiosulfate reductase cytochrome b subunit
MRRQTAILIAFLATATIASCLSTVAAEVPPATHNSSDANISPGRFGEIHNPMHPVFAVFDEDGAPTALSGRPASVERTCGTCHDARYINQHNEHWTAQVKASCVECHFEGGQLPRDQAAYDETGKLRREAIRISAPRDENCARCHGIVHGAPEPLSLPADFGLRFGSAASGKTDALTLNTGAVFSPQDLSRSYLNLQDKERRGYPWDVHARSLVSCVDCHFAANNPAKAEVKQVKLDFLVEDPRRISISQFLHRPDHRLSAASCRSCHDPLKVHAFLPYKRRHLDALECQTCHVPHLMGPAAQSIDAAVVTMEGRPLIRYRGLEPKGEETLNTAYNRGYVPIVLPHRDPAGRIRLAPFNVVETFSWADGASGPLVAFELTVNAYLENGRYAPVVLSAFDADRDGRVSQGELRLDNAAKTELIRARLREQGIADPVVRREISFHAIEHGVQAGRQVQHDCAACHDQQSRMSAGLALASFTPPPADSLPPPLPAEWGVSARIRSSGRALVVEPVPNRRLYVFGHSRKGWTDKLGFALFAGVFLALTLHAGLRVLSRRRRRGTTPVATRRVYLYTAYERVWHWLMGFSILALMLTGMQVHVSGARALISLPRAVVIHNFFAAVLTINAFLALFYHLATSAIRQFLPPTDKLVSKVAAQAHYYTRGIFLGQPHPVSKAEGRKLNPLQQLTYLALLNLLFPFQVITGIVIWGASRWPGLADGIGGLTVVAPLHNLGSWLFLTFFVLHVYLTTTGHTVLSSIRAMIDGHEEIEAGHQLATGGSNA